MLTLFAYAFLALSLVLAYWFMIRPLLRARPAYADFFRVSESRWAAFWLKLSSIKTKLLALLLIIANGLLGLHDFLIPLATGGSIDWTPLTSRVPPWAWPIIAMGFSALFFWLRKVTAATAEKKLVAVEAGVITAKQAIHADDASVEAAVILGVKKPDDDIDSDLIPPGRNGW